MPQTEPTGAHVINHAPTQAAPPIYIHGHQREPPLFAGRRGGDVEDWLDDYDRFFVFLAMFLYGGDAFFKYKAWKSGEPAQGAEIGAQCRAWSFKRGVTYLPQLPCLLTMHATKSCTHPSGYDQLEGRVV
ncbi:uncharacterized protein LOC119180082 isoform X1 [Rhipicephalus microplus]|uniref:uncharacterized protein LOC119180082 isoform X1 n=1 Tax=Rhipicephalus microplus TaxID=6941 RepID=UPI003F6D066D